MIIKDMKSSSFGIRKWFHSSTKADKMKLMQSLKRHKIRSLNMGKEFVKPILFMFILLCYIFFVPPSSLFALIGFYTLVVFASFLLLDIFFPKKRALAYSIFLIVYLLLRQYHIANILNLLLFIALLITMEVYFRKS